MKTKRSTTPRTKPKTRTAPKPVTGVDVADVLSLFDRSEGVTANEYAQVVGISRQSAHTRLNRFIARGLIVAQRHDDTQTLADLARPAVPSRAIIFRRAKPTK